MNSRISMVLAGLLLIGALVAGYWGLVLSRPPAPAVAASPEPVISVEKNRCGRGRPEPSAGGGAGACGCAFCAPHRCRCRREKLRTVPAGSLTSIDQAIGRTPLRALGAGTWLNDESFTAGGPLARMIRTNERALAVAVDEVIGAGGQLSPGDYVDVLLFLRQDNANAEQSAQVVIPAIRLLSVGDQLGLANDGTRPYRHPPPPKNAPRPPNAAPPRAVWYWRCPNPC